MNTLSIIIPSFNHAETLSRCLDSVFAQTRRPDEVIVVDDGSTDHTSEVLAQYANKIHGIRQENQGAPVARNTGFDASSGSLVLFADADLVLDPTMLEELERALKIHPKAQVAYSDFRWGNRLFRAGTFTFDALAKQNTIHTTALIRREAFPGFDPALKRFQDWDLWLTMTRDGKQGVHVNKPLFSVKDVAGRSGISEWIPSIVFRLPWHMLKWRPARLKRYESARKTIQEKHGL